MPLAFGLAGATLGASALFWVMGAAVGAGSVARRATSGVAGDLAPVGAAPARAQKRIPPGRPGAAIAGVLCGRLCAGVAARAPAASRRSTIGVGGTVLVGRRQARFARIAGGIEVRRPGLGCAAAQDLRADRERRRFARTEQRARAPRCLRRSRPSRSLNRNAALLEDWRA